MSFLDEGTFLGKGAVADIKKDKEFNSLPSDQKAKALADLQQNKSVTTEKKSNVSEGVMKELEFMAMESSSLEEFLGNVYEEYPQHEGNAEIKEYLTKFYLDLGGPIDEGKLKKTLTGLALFTALIAGNNAINNSFPEMKALKAAYEKAEEAGDKEKMKELKDKITKQTIYLDTGKGGSQIPESIKEIVKKCYNKGMAKETIVKVVKEYQKRTTLMNEAVVGGKKVDLESLEGEDNMFIYAEFMDGTKLTDDELDQLSDDDDTVYDYFGPGGKGHSPRSDFM